MSNKTKMQYFGFYLLTTQSDNAHCFLNPKEISKYPKKKKPHDNFLR